MSKMKHFEVPDTQTPKISAPKNETLKPSEQRSLLPSDQGFYSVSTADIEPSSSNSEGNDDGNDEAFELSNHSNNSPYNSDSNVSPDEPIFPQYFNSHLIPPRIEVLSCSDDGEESLIPATASFNNSQTIYPSEYSDAAANDRRHSSPSETTANQYSTHAHSRRAFSLPSQADIALPQCQLDSHSMQPSDSVSPHIQGQPSDRGSPEKKEFSEFGDDREKYLDVRQSPTESAYHSLSSMDTFSPRTKRSCGGACACCRKSSTNTEEKSTIAKRKISNGESILEVEEEEDEEEEEEDKARRMQIAYFRRNSILFERRMQERRGSLDYVNLQSYFKGNNPFAVEQRHNVSTPSENESDVSLGHHQESYSELHAANVASSNLCEPCYDRRYGSIGDQRGPFRTDAHRQVVMQQFAELLDLEPRQNEVGSHQALSTPIAEISVAAIRDEKPEHSIVKPQAHRFLPVSILEALATRSSSENGLSTDVNESIQSSQTTPTLSSSDVNTVQNLRSIPNSPLNSDCWPTSYTDDSLRSRRLPNSVHEPLIVNASRANVVTSAQDSGRQSNPHSMGQSPTSSLMRNGDQQSAIQSPTYSWMRYGGRQSATQGIVQSPSPSSMRYGGPQSNTRGTIQNTTPLHPYNTDGRSNTQSTMRSPTSSYAHCEHQQSTAQNPVQSPINSIDERKSNRSRNTSLRSVSSLSFGSDELDVRDLQRRMVRVLSPNNMTQDPTNNSRSSSVTSLCRSPRMRRLMDQYSKSVED